MTDQAGVPPLLRVRSQAPGTASATGDFLNASHRTWPHSARHRPRGLPPRVRLDDQNML